MANITAGRQIDVCIFATNLDFILRSRGITTIALGGFLTNCCVESTMREALRLQAAPEA